MKETITDRLKETITNRKFHKKLMDMHEILQKYSTMTLDSCKKEKKKSINLPRIMARFADVVHVVVTGRATTLSTQKLGPGI